MLISNNIFFSLNYLKLARIELSVNFGNVQFTRYQKSRVGESSVNTSHLNSNINQPYWVVPSNHRNLNLGSGNTRDLAEFPIHQDHWPFLKSRRRCPCSQRRSRNYHQTSLALPRYQNPQDSIRKAIYLKYKILKYIGK